MSVEICKKDCNMVTFCRKKQPEDVPANNSAVFQTLYKHYKHPIYNFFCQRINYDTSAAEDLTQDAFTKIYQNINKINDYCRIKSWIYTIAKNTYIDYCRRNLNNPFQNTTLDLNSVTLTTDENLPLHKLLHNELELSLNDIYKALPPKYFRAIFLHEYENYTYAQSARIMNLSLAAYTSLLNRARMKLKKIIISRLFHIDKDTLTKDEFDTFSKWITPSQLSDSVTRPIKHGMLGYFNETAESYNELRYHNYHNLIDDYILSRYPLKKDHIAADFGMGPGIFTSKLCPYVRQVDGYDFSKEMCDLARETFILHGIDNVVCKNTDFLRQKTLSVKYDYAYCITVLHHLTYPQNAVKKMAGMIKDGGGLVISDFAKHKCNELVEEKNDLWYGFTKEQFTKFLTEAGLKKVWVKIHKEFPVIFRLHSGEIIKIPTIIGGGEK